MVDVDVGGTGEVVVGVDVVVVVNVVIAVDGDAVVVV